MSIRRGSLTVLAAVFALTACQPGEEQQTPSKRTFLTMTPVAPGSRDVQMGATLTVKVNAKTIENGVTTPAAGGTVALTATGPGTLDADTVTLDAEGFGEFVFTACEEDDEGCTDRATVTVKASITVDGDAVAGNLLLTVRGIPGQRDCSVCGDGCLGADCAVDGEPGVCNALVCVAGAGSTDLFALEAGLYNSFGEVLDPARVPVNSSEPVEVRVKVVGAGAGAPVKGADVVVTADNGVGLVGLIKDAPAADRKVSNLGKTNDDGVFRAFVFPGANLANGSVVVQAAGLTQRFDLDVVKAGILAFAPAETDTFTRVMGVASSGYREQNTLRFRLLDTEGQPFVGGASMSFEIIGNPGGVSVFPPTARIDENAEATVNLRSGPVAGTVLVRATAVIDGDAGVTPETVSDQIVVVGAKVNGRNIAVSCEFAAVPGLWGNDCSFMRIDEHTACRAVLGDRYNNAIGRKVSVFWSTEAGLFGPPSTTGEADPDAEPADQAELGRTSNTLRTFNARMPKDVPPLDTPGDEEPRRTGGPDDCLARDGGVRTFNPRDGLVTFIVHTKGEEGFWDRNNNGRYDEGEEFLDIGEPYIDANDNGQYDPDEEFVDTNDNGAYDPPNGEWDADTTLWAEGHVLYTNHAQLVTWTPASIPDIELAQSTPVAVNFKDENLNATAPAFSTYSLTVADPAAGEMRVHSLTENIADTFGFRVAQQTTCLTGDDGACTIKTRLSGLADVDGYTVFGTYVAPESEPALDTLRATATVTGTNSSSITVLAGNTVNVLTPPEPEPDPEP